MKVLVQIPLLLFVFISYGMLTLFSPALIGIQYENTPHSIVNPITAAPSITDAANDGQASAAQTATEIPSTPPVTPRAPTSEVHDKPVPLDAPASILFSMHLVSGKTWSLNVNEAFIIISLFILFVEIFKATRTSVGSIIDHLLSTFVFLAFVIMFLTVKEAGTSTFFILTIISMIDVMCGFTVSISSARRDLAVGNERLL
ncbi:MAG: hypothetical protein BWY82_00820 [Verrucomicrobia bacterium ADurb.Bin474]|nr:MAG: hypothetical protein BWY82_00820 [Verrucomicrobia bacterium ADurb.Bin474]